MAIPTLRDFLKLESAAGMVLMAAAVLAILVENVGLSHIYDLLLTTPVVVSVGTLDIAKPLLLWVNDGLMAVFFFLVGLELKREVLEGDLSSRDQIILPGIAAIGGMAAPALVYTIFNIDDAEAMRGWAIPAATDIAFALGILALLGSRAPVTLKIFLTALAILDDLGAIVVIAIFYTADLSVLSLAISAVGLVGLVVLNLLGVTRLTPYMLIGIFVWVCVLKSGVHATLAGVALAMAIPLRAQDEQGRSPLRRLEHGLHPWVAFAILPIFGFANAGLYLGDVSVEAMLAPIPLGVALGLFVGKQIGVFGGAWLTIKLGVARLPDGCTWPMMYGVCLLTGVGFTMSLFIGGLAFNDIAHVNMVKLGVLLGSLLSGTVGFAVLYFAVRNRRPPVTQADHDPLVA